MITVKFTCAGCGLVDAEARVEGRDPTENVVSWVNKVMAEVSQVHRDCSPDCTSTNCDLKVPCGDDGTGNMSIGREQEEPR